MSKNRIALDLKQFKHVKSDKHSTTLQHKDGHMLTLAHSALNPENQKQLAALSKMNKDQVEPGDRGEKAADLQQGQSLPHFAQGGDTSYLKGMTDAVSDAGKSLSDKLSQGVDNIKKGASEGISKPTPAPSSSNNGHYKSSATGDEYAEGGEVIPSGQYEPPQMATVDPEVAARQAIKSQDPIPVTTPDQPADAGLDSKKALYNQQLSASGAAISDKDMFGPNGEPPANPVNPTIWSNVQNSPQAQQDMAAELQKSKDVADKGPAASQQQADHDQALAQNVTNAQTGKPQVADPGAPMDAGLSNYSGMLGQAYQNEIAGTQAQAAAQGQLGQQQADILAQRQAAQQKSQEAYQASYNDLVHEQDGLQHDIKEGFIDPEQFWKGVKDPATGEVHGGHSKIAAGIGMILAGMDSGINGGPNKVTSFIQYQIDKNIEAQTHNLQEKDNLLSHNIRKFGNLRDATEMTRAQMMGIFNTQLETAAAKAQNPLAKAAAQKAIGDIQGKYAPIFMQTAMRQSMMRLANDPNGADPNAIEHTIAMARQFNPEMAKDMASRYVPGYRGLSPVEVPQAARTQLESRAQLDAAAKDMYSWAAKHTGSISPSDIAVGKQKALRLQSLYREGVLNTVYREGEQPLLDKVVNKDPTSFFNAFSTLPKLKEVIAGNEMGRRVLANTYRLQIPGAQGQQMTQDPNAAAKAWANANPQDPRAVKIHQLLGK